MKRNHDDYMDHMAMMRDAYDSFIAPEEDPEELEDEKTMIVYRLNMFNYGNLMLNMFRGAPAMYNMCNFIGEQVKETLERDGIEVEERNLKSNLPTTGNKYELVTDHTIIYIIQGYQMFDRYTPSNSKVINLDENNSVVDLNKLVETIEEIESQYSIDDLSNNPTIYGYRGIRQYCFCCDKETQSSLYFEIKNYVAQVTNKKYKVTRDIVRCNKTDIIVIIVSNETNPICYICMNEYESLIKRYTELQRESNNNREEYYVIRVDDLKTLKIAVKHFISGRYKEDYPEEVTNNTEEPVVEKAIEVPKVEEPVKEEKQKEESKRPSSWLIDIDFNTDKPYEYQKEAMHAIEKVVKEYTMEGVIGSSNFKNYYD